MENVKQQLPEYLTRRQAKIQTSGISITEAGKEHKFVGVRTPLYGYRGYTNPLTKDLVEIQRAQEENQKKIDELSAQAKIENAKKKQERKDAEIEAEIAKRNLSKPEKTEKTNA